MNPLLLARPGTREQLSEPRDNALIFRTVSGANVERVL
jgi:hypothetical protein